MFLNFGFYGELNVTAATAKLLKKNCSNERVKLRKPVGCLENSKNL